MPEDLLCTIRFALLKIHEDEWEFINNLNGAYSRDVDIYLLAKFGQFKHHEIGVYYGLSERRIGQIVQQIKEDI